MKKVLAIVLALIMALSLAVCVSASGKETTTAKFDFLAEDFFTENPIVRDPIVYDDAHDTLSFGDGVVSVEMKDGGIYYCDYSDGNYLCTWGEDSFYTISVPEGYKITDIKINLGFDEFFDRNDNLYKKYYYGLQCSYDVNTTTGEITDDTPNSYIIKANGVEVELGLNQEENYEYYTPAEDDILTEFTAENEYFEWCPYFTSLEVTYEKVTYSVSVDSAVTNGKVTTDLTDAAPGDVVTVTAAPNDGYELEKVTVDGTEIKVGDTGAYTFVMGNKDAVVSATFTAKPVVNPNPPTGDSIALISLALMAVVSVAGVAVCKKLAK